ncbi:ABC transporter permease, partial [Paenibacillus ihuae]|uniref:ABC transporter permease n=1 Tax=Paenibacillus ihuae TaxID=1232431 RepID=UPI001FD86EF6
MFNYIVRRILIIIPVLLGITIINFIIMNMAPGDPVEMFMDANTPVELIEAKKEALGLNDPLYMQYAKWLLQLVQGNLGYSISSSEPVGQMILQRLGATCLLAAVALIVALLIAVPVGIFSALMQNSKWDYLVTGLSFVGTSIPNFFLGLALIYLFSLQLGLLPTGGMTELGGDGGLWDRIRHMILPVIVLSTGIAGRKVRYVRASMLDVLKQDYLRTARAK